MKISDIINGKHDKEIKKHKEEHSLNRQRGKANAPVKEKKEKKEK